MAEAPEESAIVVKEKLPFRVIPRLELLLTRYKANAAIRAANKARYDRTIARAKATLKEANKAIDADDKFIVDAIVKTLQREPSEFISRYGREIKFEGIGVLKFNTIGVSAELPRVPGPLIQYLLTRRGGKKLLRIEWHLDKDAFKYINDKLRTQLSRRFKVWVGPHKSITVQLEGEDEPTQIDYRRTSHPRRR